jgi:hypothetical protein
VIKEKSGQSALTQTREIRLTIEEYSVIRGPNRFHDASEDMCDILGNAIACFEVKKLMTWEKTIDVVDGRSTNSEAASLQGGRCSIYRGLANRDYFRLN